MYPYIVQQSITIWQAHRPKTARFFMLFGVAVLVPLILGYTRGPIGYSAARYGRERLSLTPAEQNPRPLAPAPVVVRRPFGSAGVGTVSILPMA